MTPQRLRSRIGARSTRAAPCALARHQRHRTTPACARTCPNASQTHPKRIPNSSRTRLKRIQTRPNHIHRGCPTRPSPTSRATPPSASATTPSNSSRGATTAPLSRCRRRSCRRRTLVARRQRRMRVVWEWAARATARCRGRLLRSGCVRGLRGQKRRWRQWGLRSLIRLQPVYHVSLHAEGPRHPSLGSWPCCSPPSAVPCALAPRSLLLTSCFVHDRRRP